MSNSKLVSYTGLSPNHSGKRTCSISRITPHAVVGQLSVESICNGFSDMGRQASCNYAIGTDGKRKLVWIADRDKALIYEVKPDEMLLTVHRWFARKSCPGNWLMERLGSLVDEVNHKISLSD